jgi:mycofactocin biosynthesis protein MftB
MAFAIERAWRLDRRVAIRPEPFGALAYHFGTRRLSFLKSPVLVDVLRSLDEHPSARAACRAAGVGDDELPMFEQALATLAQTGMIAPRAT